MKSIALKKISLFLALALLFCSLSVVHVDASSVFDQSKPIFGLTADDVVEKYNQLSDQQKDQVLRSLGNTSIFANSLFGNIFNSTFGALDDVVKKLGDLFFQANGVIYKLGSSALAWVSRLIDKVFNNDLNDLNISQPVVDDLYLNTRSLLFSVPPLFEQPNYISGVSNDLWGFVFPLPTDNFTYLSFFNIGNVDYFNLSVPVDLTLDVNLYSSSGILVNLDNYSLGYCSFNYSIDNFNNHIYLSSSGPYYRFWLSANNLSWRDTNKNNSQFAMPGFISISGDYLDELTTFLHSYFVYADRYYIVENNIISTVLISTSSQDVNVTNNTYYNYIYNIPDQTPLNVYNIVSNTAIDYSPADNIAYYLPDQYDIEQNFTVVNNYYISSGSAISSQGSIDVNLVSPSVIDVRITNPEDISSEVINENNTDIINNYDFDFGDLIIKNTVGTGIDNARDNLSHVVNSSSENVINGFVSGIPSDWKIAIFAFMALGFIILVINKVIGK